MIPATGDTAPPYLDLRGLTKVYASRDGTVRALDQVSLSGGRVRDVLVLGVSPQYRDIRNLVVPQGRFFDEQDAMARDKVVRLGADATPEPNKAAS